jgi:hypothetical protein
MYECELVQAADCSESVMRSSTVLSQSAARVSESIASSSAVNRVRSSVLEITSLREQLDNLPAED